eukprot:1146884-Pelagomonas_calceolata.AAC.1
MPAGTRYVFLNQSGTCGLSPNACSRTNCQIRLADAINGPVACSEDLAMLTFSWNHMPRYLKDSLWANGTPPTQNTGKLEFDELECTTSDLAALMTRCFLRA